jgi:hypothetical protein
MSNTATIVVVAIIAVVLAVIAFLIIRRVRYKRALKARGWWFDSNPALETVLDHQAPPFGLGFVREVDEGVAGGTKAGIPFRVFEYKCTAGGPKFDQRIASLQLPLPLPDLFISTGGVRNGVRFAPVEIDPRLQVRAADPAYAATVLSPAVLNAVALFGQSDHAVDLSIDGNHLVAVGAPKNPDQLEAYLEALAPIVQAIDTTAVAPYAVAPPPSYFGFYGRPDWVYVGRDDSLISAYGLTQVGFGHYTDQVVRAGNDGLPIDAFVHHWKTTHTETSTDANGNTSTRTVTDNHSETICVLNMPFAFPLISTDGSWGGKRVKFESEEFNDRFKIKTNSPKFAYDVVHPRTMEFLVAAPPPPFRLEDHQMRFNVSTHDTLLIGYCADFAHSFFARVPPFVWANLGVTPPAFRVTA